MLPRIRVAPRRAPRRQPTATQVPWGVLLSGGLDSSLVASVAQRALKRKVAEGGEARRRRGKGASARAEEQLIQS